MHESGLVEELIDEVTRLAHLNSANRVHRVQVGIGEMAGFTREHFEEHFRHASAGTLADGAILHTIIRKGDALILESIDLDQE
jgi:hydrogenase nickel incorporation protein HypA/HybF